MPMTALQHLLTTLLSTQGPMTTSELANCVPFSALSIAASLNSLECKDKRLSHSRAQGAKYATWQYVGKLAPVAIVNVSSQAMSAPNRKVPSPVAGVYGVQVAYISGDLLWVINPLSNALCCVSVSDIESGGSAVCSIYTQEISRLRAEVAKLEDAVRSQSNVSMVTDLSCPAAQGWVVWSPQSNKPIKVSYPGEDAARAVARDMAKSYPGQTFHVMAVLDGHKVVTVHEEQQVKFHR